MIHIKEHKQKDLFDPWAFLGPKRRELLDQSWAGLFQKELLYELPVGEMIPFFTHGFGRPTKELYTVLGALVLQQAHDLTDEETVNQVAFNTPWHDALNTAKAAHQRGLSGHIHAIFVVKEHVLMAWGQLQKIFILFDRSYGRMPIMAG